jgi:hypothetical protein
VKTWPGTQRTNPPCIRRYLRELRRKILAKHPGLTVEMGIMALDGSVEPVD